MQNRRKFLAGFLTPAALCQADPAGVKPTRFYPVHYPVHTLEVELDFPTPAPMSGYGTPAGFRDGIRISSS
jgi:hypothetical protein